MVATSVPPSTGNILDMTLPRAIEAHWREHRPNMVAEVESIGRLKEAIASAADRTTHAESAAIRNGMPAADAQELFREQWAFLPAENVKASLPPEGDALALEASESEG